MEATGSRALGVGLSVCILYIHVHAWCLKGPRGKDKGRGRVDILRYGPVQWSLLSDSPGATSVLFPVPKLF